VSPVNTPGGTPTARESVREPVHETGHTSRSGNSTALTDHASTARGSAVRRTGYRTGRALVRAGRAVLRCTTTAGWVLLALAVVGLAAGYAGGWTELVCLGYGAAILVLVSLPFLIGTPRYTVELVLERTRTRIGHPVPAHVLLRDRSRVRAWSTRLEVVVGDEVVQLPAPGRDGATREFPVPAVRRGVVAVGPVRAVRGDPLGLFRRRAEFSERREVHVHPLTVQLPPTSTGFVRDLEGQPTKDLTSADISFHALREYRPGDDPRHVYWKAVARTGELMVRQFEETRRSHLVVAFGRDESSWADEEEFELGLAAAASLGVRALRDGRDVTVVTSPATREPGAPPAREPTFVPTASVTRLLDGMSEVQWASGELGVGELASLAGATVPGISIVFLVVGSRPGMRELSSWSQRFPAGVRTLAVVCSAGQLPSRQEVAGLSVLRIGYLEDLRRALVRGRSG